MPRIFAYIVHKSGVADDSAAELVAAARAIDPASSPTAILTGWGPDFDLACKSLASTFGEIWKLSNQALAYPNAELVRRALVHVLPSDCIVLVSHDHFGIDLAPGLSIKLNAAYASDVLAVEGVEGNTLKLVRQEFGGQVSSHVRCDISSGAVINVRPGAFNRRPLLRFRVSSSTSRQRLALLQHDAATSRPSSPKPVMSTSPATACWSPLAAAFRRRTTSPSPKSWPKCSAQPSVARVQSSTPSGWKSPARSDPPGKLSSLRSTWLAASVAHSSTWLESKAARS